MPLLTIPSGNVASALPSGYDVDNSLRFNGADSARLSIANPTAGNRKTGSLSFWIKFCDLNANHNIFNTYNSSASGYSSAFIQVTTAGRIEIVNYQASGGSHSHLGTNRLLKDFSSWYHCLCVWDTTQSSSSDRLKIYINGTQETSFATAVYPSLNEDLFFDIGGTSNPRYIGYAFSAYMDAYLAEMFYVNGTALTPSSFGEFDEDTPTIWKPKDCKGDLTFGDEGFYLDFEDSSNLGLDTSGNSNNFTATNLAATDQSTDTCTNNFCTWNFLTGSASGYAMAYSQGNLHVDGDGSWSNSMGTFGVTAGKWYWEIENFTYEHTQVGIASAYIDWGSAGVQDLTGTTLYYNSSGGEVRKDGSMTTANYGTFGTNDVLGIALNMDDRQITFYKNGSAIVSNYAISTSIITAVPIIAISGDYTIDANFGSPAIAITSGNADANGYGNFEYAVPSGYYALCSKNLAEFGG